MSTNNTKQAAWVAIGSLCSYSITLISSMILSRFFNKADYGTYQQVLYVYNSLLTVFTLGLPRAFSYFLPRIPDDQAKSLINKLTRVFFALGIVFSLVLFFFSPLISRLLNNPELDKALKYFSIVPALLLPTLGLDGIMATYRKTQYLAIYKTVTSLLTLLCVAFPVMLLDYGYLEAIKGFVIGSAIQCALALFLRSTPVRFFGKSPCQVSFKEILNFSLPLLQASLWGILINSTDQFFISRFFGNETFAVFSNGSMELPFVPMLVGACAVVLSPVFSRMSHEQVDFKTRVFPLWKGVFDKSIKLVYPILLYCIFFATPIMEALYGNQYSESGFYFRLKMGVNFFNLIAFAPLLINTGKVKQYSNVHAITAAALILFDFVSSAVFNSPHLVAIASLICNIGKVLIMMAIVARIFDVRLIDLFPFKTIFQITIPSTLVLFTVSLFLGSILNLNCWSQILISLFLYGLFYCVYCKMMKIDYLTILKSLR